MRERGSPSAEPEAAVDALPHSVGEGRSVAPQPPPALRSESAGRHELASPALLLALTPDCISYTVRRPSQVGATLTTCQLVNTVL